ERRRGPRGVPPPPLDRRVAEVAADTDVIDAADLDRVIDLPHQHLDGWRTRARADERHEGDADYAAFVGHGLELAVLLAARVAVDLAATAVGDERRLLRLRDALGCGPRPAVTEVEGEAKRV